MKTEEIINENDAGSVQHLDSEYLVHAEQGTDAGVKKVNEDCVGLRLPEGSTLTFKGIASVVADGVSAAEKGKEAAECAVKGFLSDYYSCPDSWSVKTAGQKVLTSLNRWLYGQGQDFANIQKGYVCTFSALIIKSRSAFIFHVGDSRIVRLRGNTLEPLTTDHAVQVNATTCYLTRALGMDLNVDIDYRHLDVEEGDVFFLSTDGVHDFISNQNITEALHRYRSGERGVCDEMIQLALANNSLDNLSCQILHVERLPEAGDVQAYKKLTELPFPPPLEVGQKLDSYLVEKQIHASNRSQLYLVKDLEDENHRRLVMKTPSVNFEDDLAYIERFVLESWVAQRIDNPHVLKLANINRPRHFLYGVLEYIEGPTLEKWIEENNNADISVVVDIAEQIMRGLRAFHRRDTLHQDLKPGNIILEGGKKAVVVDFGSCFAAGIDEISSPIRRDKILGTASYSAPEHHTLQRPDVRSDLFSLGVIVYEMLTGHRPYGEKYDSCVQLRDFHKLSYRPAYHFNPLVPVWMDAAIQKAVNLNPTMRYEDVSEFIHDLKRPNSAFDSFNKTPLLERNPLLFWKITSLSLALLLVLTWIYIMGGGV
ncbi:MAG: bifunctional protein-serine/threonine kinase/phosphatase [Pseudomonadales bacterium]|nr:bifunctional protein-serine/threonine kinase/phosphatase [Pseudomonadales bacterium]